MIEGKRYPREFLLSELKAVAKKLGKIPTMEEFRAESSVSPVTLAKRFNGWKKALQSAGFDPSKERFLYDELEFIEELQRVAKEIGHTPTTIEFTNASEYSPTTISGRLGGSWDAACKAANLIPPIRLEPKPPGGWNKGNRKFKISRDELVYLYETEGLSASSIALKHGVSLNTVLRAIRDYGVKVRRLQYSMPKETTIETLMYEEMERRGVTFVKQQVIDGFWVVDALIPGPRIVIECDGKYWHQKPEMIKRDKKKDAYLISRGYRVLRFPEDAIRVDVKACVDRIVRTLVEFYDHS
jgi:very-short-patch-repair endonuclease